MITHRPICLVLVLLLTAFAAFSVMASDAHESLDDPVLEARYQQLVSELRCLVCQNENIAESNAELARDLRARVREMLVDGATDQEIKRYMTDRYGDFVLYRPPMRANTLLLWFGPAILLLLGAIILVVTVRRKSQLEADEESQLEERE